MKVTTHYLNVISVDFNLNVDLNRGIFKELIKRGRPNFWEYREAKWRPRTNIYLGLYLSILDNGPSQAHFEITRNSEGVTIALHGLINMRYYDGHDKKKFCDAIIELIEKEIQPQ